MIAVNGDEKVEQMESNSAALITPHTKFEAIFSKDVGRDMFQAKTDVSSQVSYFRLFNLTRSTYKNDSHVFEMPMQRPFQTCTHF